LRARVLAAIQRVGPVGLTGRRTGGLALLATRGIAAAEPYLVRYLPALVTAAVLPLATVAAIAWLDWWSALVVVLTLPLVPVFAILVGLTTRDKADAQYAALSALAGHFVDVVRGLPTLVVHRRARAQTDTIAAVTDRYRRTTVDTMRLAFASSGVLELVATISVALVAVLVGLRLAGGSLELQVALTVLLLAPEAYWPLRRVGAEFHAAAEGSATLEEVLALDDLDLDPLHDLDDPATGSLLGALDVPRPLRLHDLELTWPERTTPAVRRLDAVLPARGLVAISGASGSGKSTLLAALVGDLEPTHGAVEVGGVPVHELEPALWRGRIAWLPQRPWLQSDTISANLRLGAPEATEPELWAALTSVGLATVVAALPAGLATELGEDGAGLSAGQRARLALARVVLAKRPLVVLDEPSAHLDAESEEVVLRVIRELATSALVVVVAHRPALVQEADHVITLPAPLVPERERPVASLLPRPRTDADASPAPRDHDAASGLETSDTTETGTSRWRWALATFLGAGSSLAGVALTATAGWLIVRASEQPPVLMLMVAIVGVRAFGLARPAMRYAERLLSHDLVLRMLARRRTEVYAALVPLVPGALGRRRGDLLAGVVDDVDALLDDRLRVRQPVASAIWVVLVTCAVVGWLLPVAGLVLLLTATVAGAAAYALGRWGARHAETAAVTHRSDLSARVTELVTDLRDLRLWQRDDHAAERALDSGERLAAAQHRSLRGQAFGRAAVAPLVLAAIVAIAATGSREYADGAISGPLLALALLVPLALADVLTPLAEAGALRVRTRAAQERLDDLSSRRPVVTDPQHPAPRPGPHPRLDAVRISAGYGGRDAFTDLDLRLRPGTRVGVVGPSGSGKSTLAAVLLRFIDPRTGHVDLDGVDVRQLALDDVRSRVLLVDDDPYVFGSSVVENVRLARPDATDHEVAAALERAGLGDWVAGLPAGLHTRVGDGGAAVSGGERARLGLARAILADPPVLVLDEPTAHLDGPTARAVTADLLRDRDRTLVWITHDGIGLDEMDQVLRLGDAPSSVPVLPS
ncbi:thiol reductant ABC exporter subunit CydD, partial [Nocardioides massiliensis]